MTLVSGYNWLDQGDGRYRVLTPAHKEYEVDLVTETCTCPRFPFLAGKPCKHIEYIRAETAPKPEKVKRSQQPFKVSGKAVTEFEARMRANIANDYA